MSEPKRPSSRHVSPDDEPGFEDALQQVEEIIERIESGEVGLERSITEYERGMGLLRRCKDILQKAEQRVEELNRQMEAESPGVAKPGPRTSSRASEGPTQPPSRR